MNILFTDPKLIVIQTPKKTDLSRKLKKKGAS